MPPGTIRRTCGRKNGQTTGATNGGQAAHLSTLARRFRDDRGGVSILDIERYPRRVSVRLTADTATELARISAAIDGGTVAAVCRAAIVRRLPSLREALRKERARVTRPDAIATAVRGDAPDAEPGTLALASFASAATMTPPSPPTAPHPRPKTTGRTAPTPARLSKRAASCGCRTRTNEPAGFARTENGAPWGAPGRRPGRPRCAAVSAGGPAEHGALLCELCRVSDWPPFEPQAQRDCKAQIGGRRAHLYGSLNGRE